MNSAYKNIFKATALLGSVQGLNILLNLIRSKLVAIFLGPAGVGLNGIYNETKELLHETTNMGMDQSGVQTISIAYEEFLKSNDDTQLCNSIKLTRSWVVLFAVIGLLFCSIFSCPISLMTFGNTEHTLDFVFLSPAVAMATIICGETAILKATRQLKRIAFLSSVNIIIGIVTCIPLYILWGFRGIIPAILLCLLVQMSVTMFFSYKNNKPEFCFEKAFLSTGKAMILLGGALVLQGIIAHGTKLGIQSYINTNGSLADVGLFNAMTTMISSYLGLFAYAIHTDFYPRLAGVFKDYDARQQTVTRQIDVIQLFTAPMIVVMLSCLHILVPLLLSSDFNAMIPALEIALISCLTRSMSQPLAFMPLAGGEPKSFLALDVVDYALMLATYITCYALWGFIGLGFGIFLYNILDLLWCCLFARVKYGVSPNKRNVLFLIIQTIIILCTYMAATTLSGVTYIIACVCAVSLSAAVSLKLFQVINREQ